MAQVHFPPLAWQLTTHDPNLLDKQKWADVSRWLSYPPGERLTFKSVCTPLPRVELPRHARGGDGWVEMLSDEITFMVHSDDVSPGFDRLTNRQIPTQTN